MNYQRTKPEAIPPVKRVYHQPRTEEENLLNFGYSKDRRPDLVQYRQMARNFRSNGNASIGGDPARK